MDKAIHEMYSDLVESEYAQEKLKYEGLKFTRYYINSSVSNIGESVSQNFKAGDRVRVTYDTVVTKSSDWSIGYVEVVSAIQIPVYSQGDKRKTAQPTSLIPLENLTKLGPESDPIKTVRVKQGKEFLVAVKKPSYDSFQPSSWVLVASYDGYRLGERFSNAQVKDWDVLGRNEA